MPELESGAGYTGGKPARLIRDAGCDCFEAFRPMPDSVKPGHDCQQHLCRADIRGGFLPPDMLLPCLQGKAVRRPPLGIHRHTNQTAGHPALKFLPRRKKGGVRAAKTHRNTETLG